MNPDGQYNQKKKEEKKRETWIRIQNDRSTTLEANVQKKKEKKEKKKEEWNQDIIIFM